MVRDPDDELAHTATAEGDSPGPPGPAVPAPATVGRYRLERELGVGGMGVVHVAFDPDLERRVALKLLRNHGGDAAKRLQREARAMARLTHPNVVTVHEVGTAAGRDYLLRTPPIQAVAKAGDLMVRLGAPDGEASACATALPDDFGDPDLRRKLDANYGKLMLTCVPITTEDTVTIEVAPFPRLD